MSYAPLKFFCGTHIMHRIRASTRPASVVKHVSLYSGSSSTSRKPFANGFLMATPSILVPCYVSMVRLQAMKISPSYLQHSCAFHICLWASVRICSSRPSMSTLPGVCCKLSIPMNRLEIAKWPQASAKTSRACQIKCYMCLNAGQL
jgi:hypothetical protein